MNLPGDIFTKGIWCFGKIPRQDATWKQKNNLFPLQALPSTFVQAFEESSSCQSQSGGENDCCFSGGWVPLLACWAGLHPWGISLQLLSLKQDRHLINKTTGEGKARVRSCSSPQHHPMAQVYNRLHFPHGIVVSTSCLFLQLFQPVNGKAE